jgi:hypothetical protein
LRKTSTAVIKARELLREHLGECQVSAVGNEEAMEERAVHVRKLLPSVGVNANATGDVAFDRGAVACVYSRRAINADLADVSCSPSGCVLHHA